MELFHTNALIKHLVRLKRSRDNQIKYSHENIIVFAPFCISNNISEWFIPNGKLMSIKKHTLFSSFLTAASFDVILLYYDVF